MLGKSYPNLGGLCLMSIFPKRVVPPPLCHQPAKTNKQKLVGKAVKVTKNSNFFC
jgi:hypothetical protein